MENKYDIRPEVLTYEDVCKMAPALAGHKKFVDGVFKFLKLDRVNDVHSRHCHTPGIPFTHALIEDEFKVKLRVDNEDILKRFPTQPFITVSNHPFGGLDGIILLHLVGTYRTDYKVMVNMFLNHISAMRPGFIPVDPASSDDPEKKRVTMQGIREAIKQVKGGSPIGFFPAGAVSNFNHSLRIRDREWQPTIIRLVRQLKVPVIPIYFHGHNSFFFNLLGAIDWRLRLLRFPSEVFNKAGKEIHLSIGEPVSVEAQDKCATLEELGAMLRERTYELSAIK